MPPLPPDTAAHILGGDNAIVSIDPGRTVGYALWRNRTLAEVGAFDFHSLGFSRWIQTVAHLPAVIEMPDHVATTKESVLTCAFRAGYCAGKFAEYRAVKVREWKGSLPKDVTKLRAMKILQETGELERIGEVSHHTWDAIGLGLFALGRMRR
jgi:hypothetical protein